MCGKKLSDKRNIAMSEMKQDSPSILSGRVRRNKKMGNSLQLFCFRLTSMCYNLIMKQRNVLGIESPGI